jgi:outer membrane protein OmpA-like peptidoglycan-associated protein
MKKYLFIVTFFASICSTTNAQFWDYSEPAKLGGTINSLAEESIPVFSKDSSILYFVRSFDINNIGGKFDQDVWFSRRDNTGGYNNCEPLKDVNNKFNNAILGINKLGNSMYLLGSYGGKKDTTKGISVSHGSVDKWGAPESIKISNLDINGECYGFHVNNTETAIIISYVGPGSMGEEDLYVSLKSGSTWQAPVHMGSVINSAGFEISPFLSETGDTLFFSSNGFGGEGDADIFYSVKQGDWTDWSKPVNLGSVINSPKFDAYFIHSGKQAFWSSNRDSEKSDIWMLNILYPPALSIICASTDISEYDAGDGSIDLTVESGVEPYSYSWSNGKTTEDLKNLKRGKYKVLVTDAIGQTAETSCSIIEPEPPKDVVIRLPEVRYPLNQWSLLSDSTINSPDSLLFVYNLLTEYPGLVLELSSHTDSRGSNSANQKLSENRARACYKYLVEEKGIDARRIVPVGKGESNVRTVWLRGDEYLVVKPTDMTGVQKISLTESYINKFKRTNDEVFKMLHQLNRRTEGRVLSMDFDPNTAPAADPKFLKYVKYP